MNKIEFQYSNLEANETANLEEEAKLRRILAFGATRADRRKSLLESVMNLKN